MVPQFNLLKSRFDVVTDTWAFGSTLIQDGKSFVTLTVRQADVSYVQRRRVKGVELTEWN